MLFSAVTDTKSWVHRDGQLSLVKHLYIKGEKPAGSLMYLFYSAVGGVLGKKAKYSFTYTLEDLCIILFVPIP